jgi:hypothetical protein
MSIDNLDRFADVLKIPPSKLLVAGPASAPTPPAGS